MLTHAQKLFRWYAALWKVKVLTTSLLTTGGEGLFRDIPTSLTLRTAMPLICDLFVPLAKRGRGGAQSQLNVCDSLTSQQTGEGCSKHDDHSVRG